MTAFFIQSNHRLYGPADPAKVRMRLQERRYPDDTLFSIDRIHWLPASQFPELVAPLPVATTPAPIPAAPTPSPDDATPLPPDPRTITPWDQMPSTFEEERRNTSHTRQNALIILAFLLALIVIALVVCAGALYLKSASFQV